MKISRRALALTTVATCTVLAAAPAYALTTYVLTHASDAYTGSTTVVRWSPCAATSTGTETHYISYRINTAGQSNRVPLVQSAIAKLASASGLHFKYLGTTTYMPHDAVLHYPSGDRLMFNASQQRSATDAELVVAWAYRSQTNLLASSSEAGVGTISWRSSSTSQTRILEAAVIMKRGVTGLLANFTPGGSVGALLLHELGHAVGLQHASDLHQIMYPVIGPWSAGDYQSGDISGLHHVGWSAGCMRTSALPPTDPVAIARAAGVPVTP